MRKNNNGSQSLLIQRSYSYLEQCSMGEETSRNPFLFRGPIPTWNNALWVKKQVAIPSYSEVLFLPAGRW